LEKCLITDTETRRHQEDLKEVKAYFPADKVLEITLDYLANDPEFNEAYAYVQSEEFPRIHKIVEYLKQYKDVSNFMCMSINQQSDRWNKWLGSTDVWIALF